MTKVAVISGASRGMGRAIAFALAEKGYDLALAARDLTRLEELKKELQQIHPEGKIYTRSVDFSRKMEVRSFCENVLHLWEHVDAVINNVGKYDIGSIDEESEEAMRDMMNTNFYSAYHMTRPFISGFKARESGHVINICSVVSKAPRKEAASYTISKYALKGFNDVLREELRDFGVGVTAILPGSTYTASWEGVDIDGNLLISSEDIARTVLHCLETSPGAFVEEITLLPKDKSL